MPELHLRADRGQAAQIGRRRPVRIDPELLGRAPHQRLRGGRLGRGHRQQQPRLGRQPAHPVAVHLLQRPADMQRLGQHLRTCQLGRRQLPGHLDQRQRIPAGPGDDPSAHRGAQPPRRQRRQQLHRRILIEPADRQLRQPRQRRQLPVRLADGEQQHHPLGVQAARHKAQHHQRFGVQPLHVVGHAHQRRLRRYLGQQRQHGQRDQEPVRRRPGHQPERAPQRVPLRTGQLLQLIGEREQEPVQPGVAQLRLRLHPGQPGRLHASCYRGGDRLVQQRGLPDPGSRRAAPGRRCSPRRPWPAARRAPRVQPDGRQASRPHPSPSPWAATLPMKHRMRPHGQGSRTRSAPGAGEPAGAGHVPLGEYRSGWRGSRDREMRPDRTPEPVEARRPTSLEGSRRRRPG